MWCLCRGLLASQLLRHLSASILMVCGMHQQLQLCCTGSVAVMPRLASWASSLCMLNCLLLLYLCRYREQRDITQPESLNLFLETRFEQLKTACELEMWAEAFRSVEDIQALIALGKRQPKQQMMATYYRCE